METHTDWRMGIADLALNLHYEVLGLNHILNSLEARILRKMFSKELGVSLRGLENYIDVKVHLFEEVDGSKLRDLSFTNMVDVVNLKKKEGLSAEEALEKYTNHMIDPNSKIVKLLLRYSSNLMTNALKFNGDKNLYSNELELIKERITTAMVAIDDKR